jgi:3-oxosteroid 1-dehydrogenase
MNSQMRPDSRLPKSYFESKYLVIANTIEELAAKTGIDTAGLQATIANMNEAAKTGQDPEFNRGGTAYDRYYGDARVQPNPCLAPIAQAPFYALRVDAGDFGTNGGLDITPDAQVKKAEGGVIDGLYAIGNTAAGILTTYPGPGATLGPAMTYAYQAAKHISGWKD